MTRAEPTSADVARHPAAPNDLEGVVNKTEPSSRDTLDHGTARAHRPLPVEGGARWRQWTGFRIALVILMGFTLVWRVWTMSAWSWFQDDWVYLTQSARMPFGEYLLQDYNGHLMPLQFALAWAMTHVAPLNYDLAVAVTVVFMIGALGAWALALVELFGERIRLLIPLTILALSPVFMPITLWWAAAIQVFPLQLTMGLCVYFAARYVQRGRRARDLVLLGVSFAVGLGFWQKALLIAIPVAFVTVVLARESRSSRAIKSWSPLVLVAAMSLVYLPAYVLLTRGGKQELGAARGVGESLTFYMRGILDVGLPALLGGPWQGLSNPQSVYEPPSSSLSFLMLAIALAISVISVALRRSVWLSLLMLAVYAAVSWGLLLTSTRYTAMGVFAIRDARYAADIIPVALLAMSHVMCRLRSEPVHGWLRLPVPAEARRIVPGVTGLLLVVVGVSAIHGNGVTWDASAPHSPKPWVDAVTSDARAVNGISLQDTNPPNTVLWTVFFPEYGHLEPMLAPLSPKVKYNAPAEQIYTTREDGRIVAAEVEALATSKPGPTPQCGYLLRPGSTVDVPVDNPLFGWTWMVQLDYFSELGGEVQVRTGNRSQSLALRPGLANMQFIVTDSVPRLSITSDPDAGPICLASAKVGNSRATDRLAVDGRAGAP